MSPRRPRVLIAPDSFKGTMSAAEVAAALARGVAAAGGEPETCPLADGGEGTTDAFLAARGGEVREALVHDPLGRPLRARFALLDGGREAVLEMAAASGLALLSEAERDPLAADTAGTGELIAAAVAAGARRVLVGAGGSATVDGGRGAIEALRDAGGVGEARLVVLSDVETAYEDAAAVFGPQKGAGPEQVRLLARRQDAYASTLPRDPRGVPRTGCAGGLGGGLWAAFGAELAAGAERVLEVVGFDARAAAADLVVTGEGRLDAQSLEGKLVGTVLARCAAAGRAAAVVVGADALGPEPLPAPPAALLEAGDPEALEAAGRRVVELLSGR